MTISTPATAWPKLLARVGMRCGVDALRSGRLCCVARQSIELGDPCRAYIIDWRLPDMNGIEVTRQIRSLNDDTPIIILTAYDWSDIEVEAKAAGVTAFCSKPMFLSDLRDTLLTAISTTIITTHTTIVTIVSPEIFSSPPATEMPFHLITEGNVFAFAPKIRSATFCNR